MFQVPCIAANGAAFMSRRTIGAIIQILCGRFFCRFSRMNDVRVVFDLNAISRRHRTLHAIHTNSLRFVFSSLQHKNRNCAFVSLFLTSIQFDASVDDEQTRTKLKYDCLVAIGGSVTLYKMLEAHTANRIWSGFNWVRRVTKCHTGFSGGRRTSQGNTHIWYTAELSIFQTIIIMESVRWKMAPSGWSLMAAKSVLSKYASRNLRAPFSWKIVTSVEINKIKICVHPVDSPRSAEATDAASTDHFCSIYSVHLWSSVVVAFCWLQTPNSWIIESIHRSFAFVA